MFGRKFRWRVQVVIAPHTDIQRQMVIIVRADNRGQAVVRAMRAAMRQNPHTVFRDMTVSVLPETS